MKASILFISFSLGCSTVVSAASFTGLGFLGNGNFSQANGISSDGKVVVGTANLDANKVPFIWTKSKGMRSLGSVSGSEISGTALFVSDDGNTVLGNSSSGNPYRWSATTGAVLLNGVPTQSTIVGSSNDGNVVVGYTGEYNSGNAFRWSVTDGYQNLGARGAGDVETMVISGDGRLIAGRQGHLASTWTSDQGWAPLYSGAFFSHPTSISYDGQIVAGHIQTPGFRSNPAFLWTSGEKIIIEDTSFSEYATPDVLLYEISDDGKVWIGLERDISIGYDTEGRRHIIWDEVNGARSLTSVFINKGFDLTDWETIVPYNLSEDGSIIVGVGTKLDGSREAWIADISAVPLPATIWLFVSGLIGFVGMARRKK